ncbi:UNVERIFIED_CONTAM: MADS-box protein [Sesamum latifolium]|uniref:MADS-box protein n=1 Tax=Sesamum latifolium TaxID=2727402 RepID=A0AAW2YDI1_9LAMI
MSKTLERYHKSSYGPIEAHQSPNNAQNNYQEYLKLKARVEVLQQSQRHLLGEDLGNLGPKELDQLETVLDTSLKQIRLKQTQHMFEQLSGLQQKEKNLMEVNRALRSKLEETNAAIQETWQQGERNMPYRPVQPAQPEAFFEPLGRNSTAQIQYE